MWCWNKHAEKWWCFHLQRENRTYVKLTKSLPSGNVLLNVKVFPRFMNICSSIVKYSKDNLRWRRVKFPQLSSKLVLTKNWRLQLDVSISMLWSSSGITMEVSQVGFMILFLENWRCVVAERSSALDSSSGVIRMWVRIPAWPVTALVSLSKTLNHNCFVLRMGRKAVGPVCCVIHVKEPGTLIVKQKGAWPCVSGFAPWAPSRVDMCMLQIFCICICIGWTNCTFQNTNVAPSL